MKAVSSMDLKEIRGRTYDLAILLKRDGKSSFAAEELDEKFRLHYGSYVPVANFGFSDLSALLDGSRWFTRAGEDRSLFACILRENYKIAYKVPKNPNQGKILVNLEPEQWMLHIKKELEPDPPDTPAPTTPDIKVIPIKREPEEIPPPASPDPSLAPSPPSSPPRDAVEAEIAPVAREIPASVGGELDVQGSIVPQGAQSIPSPVGRREMAWIADALSRIEQKKTPTKDVEAQRIAEKERYDASMRRSRSVRTVRPVSRAHKDVTKASGESTVSRARSVRSFIPVAREEVCDATNPRPKSSVSFSIAKPSTQVPNLRLFPTTHEEPAQEAIAPLRPSKGSFPLPYEHKLASPYFKYKVMVFVDKVISCLASGGTIGIDTLTEIFATKCYPERFVQQFRVLFGEAPFSCLERLSGFKIVVEQNPGNTANRVTFRLEEPQIAPALFIPPPGSALPPVTVVTAPLASRNLGHHLSVVPIAPSKRVPPPAPTPMREFDLVTEIHFKKLYNDQIAAPAHLLGPVPARIHNELAPHVKKFVRSVGGILKALGGRARFDEVEFEYRKMWKASFAEACTKYLPPSMGPFNILRLISSGKIETEILGPRMVYFRLKHPIDILIDGVWEYLRSHGGKGDVASVNAWFKRSYEEDFCARCREQFGHKYLKTFHEFALLTGKFVVEQDDKGHWHFRLTVEDLVAKKEVLEGPKGAQSVVDVLMDRILECVLRLGGRTSFEQLTALYEEEIYKHPFDQLILHTFGSYQKLASVADSKKKFTLNLEREIWMFKLIEKADSATKVVEETRNAIRKKPPDVVRQPSSAATPIENMRASLAELERRNPCRLTSMKPLPSLMDVNFNRLAPQKQAFGAVGRMPSRFGDYPFSKLVVDRLISCLRKAPGYRFTVGEMTELYRKTYTKELDADQMAAFASMDVSRIQFHRDLKGKIDIFKHEKKGWIYRLEPSHRPVSSRSDDRQRRAATVVRRNSRERSRRSPSAFRSRRSPSRNNRRSRSRSRQRSRSRERRPRSKRSPSPRNSRRSRSRHRSPSPHKHDHRSRRCATVTPSRRSRSRHRSRSKEERNRSRRGRDSPAESSRTHRSHRKHSDRRRSSSRDSPLFKRPKTDKNTVALGSEVEVGSSRGTKKN